MPLVVVRVHEHWWPKWKLPKRELRIWKQVLQHRLPLFQAEPKWNDTMTANGCRKYFLFVSCNSLAYYESSSCHVIMLLTNQERTNCVCDTDQSDASKLCVWYWRSRMILHFFLKSCRLKGSWQEGTKNLLFEDTNAYFFNWTLLNDTSHPVANLINILRS